MDECKISSLLDPKEEPCTREDSSCSGSGSGAGRSSALEELEEFLGNGEEEQFVIGSEILWNFMGWEDSSSSSSSRSHFLKEEGVKQESFVPGFWEQNYNRNSLNLSLNYQEVIDAWSDRLPLVVDFYGDFSVPDANYQSNDYTGEVPVMEEEEKEKDRRRARVLKYREKRHNRLFSKKIRYEVRKINAEKRPRLKGRFVKRDPEEMLT